MNVSVENIPFPVEITHSQAVELGVLLIYCITKSVSWLNSFTPVTGCYPTVNYNTIIDITSCHNHCTFNEFLRKVVLKIFTDTSVIEIPWWWQLFALLWYCCVYVWLYIYFSIQLKMKD